jgi:nucleotide-binding universal stress UspA family protein
MAQRFVVGVDGSDAGRHALRWAVAQAAPQHTLVHAVHAWTVPAAVATMGPYTAAVDPNEYEQWAKNKLEADVALISQEAGVDERMITTELVAGDAPEVLLTRATYADLLVVGNRGRGGFKGLLLGSVSQHCAAHSPTPVAVIRRESPLPDRSDVVVGVDGSAASQAALEFAVRQAVARDARLVVAHAWWVAHPGSPSDFLPFVSVDRGTYVAQSHDLMREMLARARATTSLRPERVDLVPVEDAPAAGMLALAESAGSLVVGTRGRGGLAGMLLGSVSQQCLHHARCAVIVVPTPCGGDPTTS